MYISNSTIGKLLNANYCIKYNTSKLLIKYQLIRNCEPLIGRKSNKDKWVHKRIRFNCLQKLQTRNWKEINKENDICNSILKWMNNWKLITVHNLEVKKSKKKQHFRCNIAVESRIIMNWWPIKYRNQTSGDFKYKWMTRTI